VARRDGNNGPAARLAGLTPKSTQRSKLTQLVVLVRDDLTDGNKHCATPASLDRKTP
jgi:hypothetical protein